MADAKLSDLALRGALAGTDRVYVIAGGVSYGATVDTVVSYARTNMYPQVATYADLPVSTASGDIYIVQTSTGIWPIRKYAGFWRDTGTGWVWLGNATWVAGEIAFAPTGNIVATDVAGAIAELDSEKAIAGLITASGLTVSATDKLLGRATAGAGAIEEIALTAAGRALIDDADATAQRATLGLGSSATHPSSDFVVHPGFVAGRWYNPITSSIAAGTAPGTGSIRALPFIIEQPITITALAVRITTLAAAGNCQAAIYANDLATGSPTGNALCSTGNISTAAATVVSSNLGSTVTLQPGLYWMCVNQDNATVVYLAFATTLIGFAGHYIGSTTLANLTASATTGLVSLFRAQAFGTWPDLTGLAMTESATAAVAIVFLKAA